jgi:uncharacterized protein YjiS (DUF1127 family)
MTAQIRISTYFVAPARPFQWRNKIITLRAFRQCITEWCRRIRERNELRKLSDRDLADFMCSKLMLAPKQVNGSGRPRLMPALGH